MGKRRGSYDVSSSPQKPKKTEETILTSLRSLMVVLALSIHSVFEGMAIGLEEDQAGVWKLFLAVAIHAAAIVFCIGTEMMASRVKKKMIVMYMVVLSIVTPTQDWHNICCVHCTLTLDSPITLLPFMI